MLPLAPRQDDEVPAAAAAAAAAAVSGPGAAAAEAAAEARAGVQAAAAAAAAADAAEAAAEAAAAEAAAGSAVPGAAEAAHVPAIQHNSPVSPLVSAPHHLSSAPKAAPNAALPAAGVAHDQTQHKEAEESAGQGVRLPTGLGCPEPATPEVKKTGTRQPIPPRLLHAGKGRGGALRGGGLFGVSHEQVQGTSDGTLVRRCS